MRTKVKRASRELALTRVLDALAQELVDTSDSEVVEVAKDLGMDLEMRESAAWAGVIYPAKPQVSDFFDFDVPTKLQNPVDRVSSDSPEKTKGGPRRSKRSRIATQRKTPEGK